jgi:hypothetical protein
MTQVSDFARGLLAIEETVSNVDEYCTKCTHQFSDPGARNRRHEVIAE